LHHKEIDPIKLLKYNFLFDTSCLEIPSNEEVNGPQLYGTRSCYGI